MPPMPVLQGQKRREKVPDVAAAQVLIELREKRGLTREQVPHAMAMAGHPRTRIPSPKTLWRMEHQGHIPSIATRFELAQFYGRDVHTIWAPERPRCAA